MNPTSASRQSLSLGAELNRAALRTQTSTPRGTKRPACNPVQARMSTPRALLAAGGAPAAVAQELGF